MHSAVALVASLVAVQCGLAAEDSKTDSEEHVACFSVHNYVLVPKWAPMVMQANSLAECQRLCRDQPFSPPCASGMFFERTSKKMPFNCILNNVTKEEVPSAYRFNTHGRNEYFQIRCETCFRERSRMLVGYVMDFVPARSMHRCEQICRERSNCKSGMFYSSGTCVLNSSTKAEHPEMYVTEGDDQPHSWMSYFEVKCAH